MAVDHLLTESGFGLLTESGFGLLLEPSGGTATLPDGLAGAIVLRAAGAGIGALTKLYESQAGDRAVLPYAVFAIATGPAYFHSDTSYWHDDRVTFKCYASTQAEANAAREAIHAAFKAGDFPYASGFSIPFFQANRSEGKEPNRGKGGGYVFRSSIEYSARCRRD